MSIVTHQVKDGVLTLYLFGRIDSTNAPVAESEVFSALSSHPHTSVVMDMEELEYISSAGLRVVLRVRKTEPTLTLINVSSEVYDIFDMTGFTEMLTVEKAYRKLSVEGCEVIGQGANGKVYRLDPDTIIKVYLNPDSLPDIHRERELARRAFVLGIPTAIPYDVVKVGEGYGSVFELLNAKSFAALMNENPDNVDHYIELYVDLMKKIHSTAVKPDDMPCMKDVGVKWAEFLLDYLPAEMGEKLVRLVSDIPEVHNMLHGDYHIKNVMMQNGEVLLIDMDTLCWGHPIFELASMFNAYLGFLETRPPEEKSFLGITDELSRDIWYKSLALYLGTDDPARIKEVDNKARLMGYTRIMRRQIRRRDLEDPKRRGVVEHYRTKIMDLLTKVDTMNF